MVKETSRKQSRTLREDSLRQRALRMFEAHGEMSAHTLAIAMSISRREASNVISGLRASGYLEIVPGNGRRRYRLPRKRYERPPEGRIDIAGPVYARGYVW